MKLPEASWREGRSLDETSEDVAWFLECLQVSEYMQENTKVLVRLCAHTSAP